MKCIILFAVFVVTFAEKIDYFVTGNEYLDMDALAADHKELQAYLDCFLDKKPCTELTETYKYIVRNSLKDSCRRCTPNQKYMYRHFLQSIKKVYPEQYKEFRHYYDPENKHFDALEKEISQYIKPVYN